MTEHEHGTLAGYKQHMVRKTPTCAPCRKAHNDYNRKHRWHKSGMPRPKPQCGTRAGYDRHRRRGEEACPPCKDAKAKYSRERRALVGDFCQVPPLLLAQLYLSAPIGLQLTFEQAVGESVAAALVQRLDQAETPQ